MSTTETPSPTPENEAVEQPKMLAIKIPIPEYPHEAAVTIPMIKEVYDVIMAQPEEQRRAVMANIAINMLCDGLRAVLQPKEEAQSGLILPP